MARQGQLNYKGVNAQAWAAMSLFLQYLRDPNFSYIQLESPHFADFNLVFYDGRRIICESKAWSKEIGYPDLKNILDSILDKTTVEENEEIIIICERVNKTVSDNVGNMKYWGQFITPEFVKKSFSEKQIAILDRVKFWEVQEKDNHAIVYALFNELLDFWMPQNDLEGNADRILIEKIYGGSANGTIYHREEVLREIASIKKSVVKKSGYFDGERVKIGTQLSNILEAVKNNKSPEWAPNQLSALSSKPDLMFFALEHIKNQKIDHLKEWDGLWRLYRIYNFSFSLFRIFEENLHTAENRKYILDFFSENSNKVRRFFKHDFFDVDVVKITTKIVDQDKSFLNKAFDIVSQLTTRRYEDAFYLRESGTNDFWQKEQVANLLSKIYDNADEQLREKIYTLITQTFNLIEDDGQFSRHTPGSIFDILKVWLSQDMEGHLSKLSEVLSSQFDQYYKKFGKKMRFKGWEHMGGVTSFWGNHYTVSDRHFIVHTLAPALEQYYRESKHKGTAWKLVRDYCVTEINKVNKERPDFLNRAVLRIILERYKSQNNQVSEEARRILTEYILSSKGIPHKSELIYQILLRDDFSSDKKWELVKVSTNKHDTPINPFSEQIIEDLAADGHPQAMEVLDKWAKSPEYFKRTNFPGNNLLRNIQKLSQTDSDTAIKRFEEFIANDYFIGNSKGVLDRFETYEWARFLNDILHRDFPRGLAIINGVKEKESLSRNEQILITACLYPLNEKAIDPKILDRLYNEYVDPLLKKYGGKIKEKITYSNPREQFLQFADKIVVAKEIPNRIVKTLRIVKAFIDDPDPYLPGQDLVDPENKYNEHERILNGEETHSITSIRGWCAWVLGKCAVLDGRQNIKEIIDLTELLLKDENLYVKHMACFSLSQLARIRLSVLPNNKDTLFFGSTKLEALQRAKRVEKIAFDTLAEIAACSNSIKKVLGRSIIRVFDHIRSLNEKEALMFIDTIKTFPDEVIAETAPLFIYYAEFRKNGYKNWRWRDKGLYDDLEPKKFDDIKFKKTLEEFVKSNSSKITSKFAWHFKHIVGEIPPNSKQAPNYYKITYHYLNILSKSYDQHTFTSIYIFIKDHIEDHFKGCFELWKKCLITEKKALEKYVKQGKISEVNWYPFSYNGEILCTIYKHSGKDDFLEWFKFLCGYQKSLILGELKQAIELLKSFSKDEQKVGIIFDMLIKRNALYYNDKKEWEKQ